MINMRRLPLVTEHILAQARLKQTEVSVGFQQRTDHEGITCRKGCHNCCYHPISISIIEGVLLYLTLKQEGLWSSSLKKRCEERADLVTGLAPEPWMLAKIACPLLEGGLCLAYRSRPLVCRTTVSTGLPELCDPHRFSLETPLVSRREELLAYQTFEKSLLKGVNSPYRSLPISLAVLLGERIATGKLDFESSDSAVFEQYLKATT